MSDTYDRFAKAEHPPRQHARFKYSGFGRDYSNTTLLAMFSEAQLAEVRERFLREWPEISALVKKLPEVR